MYPPNSTVQLASGYVFSRETIGDVMILTPAADLGSFHESEISHESEDLLEIFRSRPKPVSLVIDLAQTDYFGTAILGAIVKLWKRISQNGGRIAICNVSENVIQMLRVTKLSAIWPIFPTRDEALSAIH
jgi:anti-anti-sigma factor